MALRSALCLAVLLASCSTGTGDGQGPSGQDAALAPTVDAGGPPSDAGASTDAAAVTHQDGGPGPQDAGGESLPDASAEAQDSGALPDASVSVEADAGMTVVEPDAGTADSGPTAGPTCTDQVQNGDETDADCGGSCPSWCANGAGCLDDADCASSLCRSGLCVPSVHLSGRVFALLSFLPLSGATVTADTGESAVSDVGGAFSVVLPASAAAVHVTAPGHVEQWVRVASGPDGVVLDVTLAAVGFTQAIAGADETTISTLNGVTIGVPVQAWVNTSGAPFVGDLVLDITPVDLRAAETRGSVPVDFPVEDATGPATLSGAVWAVDVSASSGQERLNVAPGSTLTMTLDVPLEDPVPQLWVYSFDPVAQVWRPEGAALRMAGDDGVPTFTLPLRHLSWYLFTLELAWGGIAVGDYGCIRGTVLMPNGQPADALIQAYCVNGPTAGARTTPSTGAFEYYTRSRSTCQIFAHTANYALRVWSTSFVVPSGTCLSIGVIQFQAPPPPNPCPGALQQCGTSCVDRSLNPAHCGACNNPCSQGQSCVAGACLCPEGKTLCGSGTQAACVDLQTSRTNCGTCGSACAVKDHCARGTCQVVPFCGDGLVESGELITEACDDGVNSGAYGGCVPGCAARSERCGDGVVQPIHGETCEAASAPCALTCVDDDACTVDTQTGTPAACTMACSRVTITALVDGDACCPAGATRLTDADCNAVCGNLLVEPSEVCDDGVNDNRYGGCAPGCASFAPFCGDGTVQTALGETCEPGVTPCETSCSDGNFCTQDALVGRVEECTAACLFLPITSPIDNDLCCPPNANAAQDNDCTPVCGNNALEPGEMCDDGNQAGTDGCSADCLSDERCGNAFVDPWEVCDHGNTTGGDGCSANCLSDERCGTGTVDPGEACDDGNTTSGDGCNASCLSNETCGNAFVDTWELCDDGNLVGADGCNATCTATREVAALSAGLNSTCVISRSGALACWGHNLLGKLGTINAQDAVMLPSRVGTAADWVTIAVGNDHRCASKQNGELYCWGYNEGGQLGIGTVSTAVATPSLVAGTWGAHDVGYGNGAALNTVDGLLYTWGTNAGGATPSAAGAGVTTWTLLSSRFSTVLTRADGTAWSGNAPRSTLSQTGTATDWLSVSAYGPRCGIRAGGSAWCWGTNTHGQLGNGGTTTSSTPQEVAPGSLWLSLAAGNEHVCGIRTDRSLWCWGRNLNARLGIGSGDANPHPTPERVGTGNDWALISAAETNTCAVKLDGTLWCWGGNSYYQLGLGSSLAARLVPTRVSLENAF